MSLNPGTAEQERLAAAAAARRAAVERRERRVEALFGGGLLVVSAVLWLVAGRGEVHLVAAIACMACLAFAVHVPFAVGGGYTVPTQLAFVPLWFTMPPALLPSAVLVALLAARLPLVLARRWPASRLLLVVGDAWFAVGPAAVFVLAGTPSLDGSHTGVIVAGILGQVLVEVATWGARERLLGGAGLREQLQELWVHGVDLALTPIALAVAATLERFPLAALAGLPLLGVLAIFSREREARLAGLTELNRAYRGTAMVLGDVVEADDGYTGEHSRGVLELALAVGDALGLDDDRRRNLEFGALLHDVGKVAIPKEIINKPGKLDADEWAIMKTHTIEGQRMLDHVGGFMAEVGLIVRSHHERWDGGGYPDGLAGEAIPLESRIIACCDTWNAMTTTRSYRPAMSAAAAGAELERVAGRQLDPRLVAIMLQRVAGSMDEPEPAPEPLASAVV
jgi:putative nucleotidyltransferase with HDIG domain